MSIKEYSVGLLVHEIKMLQGIQKSHPQWHPEWKKASKRLQARYEEMARRVKEGDAEAMAVRL